MVKTIKAPMQAHLAENVTSLATAWRIERTDGQKFYFTTASSDKVIDIEDGDGPQTYSASEGYSRSNIQNDTELNVGNMDVIGIFDNDQIREDELRAGLFDFADVRIFFFNHQDTSTAMGIIKQLRGQFSEVTLTPNGFFNVELRDLTQVFTKELGETYSKDCRADLGDNRCRVPLEPPIISRDLIVNVGEFYRVRTDPPPGPFACHALIVPFDGADGATNANDFGFTSSTLTFAGNAQLDTAQAKFGSASLLLDGTGDYVSAPDDPGFDIGGGQFTSECWVRFASVATVQNFFSQWDTAGNQRSWRLRYDQVGGQMQFIGSSNGVNSDVVVNGAWTPVIDTWYHVAVDRDSNDDIRIYADGVVLGTLNDSTSFLNSTSAFRIGTRFFGGAPSEDFNGHIDDMRVTKGTALYGGAFTPPTQANPIVDPDLGITTFPAAVFEDRIYEVAIAGTTEAGCGSNQPTYDTTIDALTVDGTATLKAVTSWTRAFSVNTIVDPKREFTTVELTPNTDFPDGWFEQGAVIFETGDNAGRAVEVRVFTADDGITIVQQVELFDDLPFPMQVGDTGRIQPGCDKRFVTCQTKFMNQENFVGEPHVPGPDTLGRYPDARS